MNDYFNCPQFLPGSNAISIVAHPPEISPGALVTIANPWIGDLCAIQLPDGMIHRWHASFELKSENSNAGLAPGSYAKVINSVGHGEPPHIEVGTTVRIVKCINTIFYDVFLANGEYHRWFAEFELANPLE